MNPGMLKQYQGLVEEFKKSENSVYDDTPDIHRAIAISDAYIGDWSSVVTLYGMTGKPIYIFDPQIDHIQDKDEENRLSFSCAAELDGYLWAPADEFNGLFKI